MPRRRRSSKRPLKKRNLAAKLSGRRPSAGPMEDKRRKSRQEQRVEDEKRVRQMDLS